MDPELKLSSDSSGTAPPGILREGEDEAFSNLYTFLAKTNRSGKSPGAVYAPTKVDSVTFFHSKPPIFNCHIRYTNHDHQASADKYDSAAAKLFIIESIDAPHIQGLLASLPPLSRDGFLRFIDDYFYDEPISNFDNVHLHIPATPSTQARQQHQTFDFLKFREFDRPFALTYQDVQGESRASGMWRNAKAYGSLNPVPRVETGGKRTVFPPIAAVRTRVAAWFDCDAGRRTWRTGKLRPAPYLLPLWSL
jgi:hypothetical protein